MKKKTSENSRLESKDFDLNEFEKQAIDSLKQGKPLEGKDGILAPLIKRWIEASLEGELDAHLKQEPVPNRRNGKMGKKLKTGFGPVDISTPRDRNSTFDPQILPKCRQPLEKHWIIK